MTREEAISWLSEMERDLSSEFGSDERWKLKEALGALGVSEEEMPK